MNNIENNSKAKKTNNKNTNLNNVSDKIVLEKLVLIVTNSCNFKCKYCYAEGGSYGLKVDNMNNEDAKQIINYFVRNFTRIKFIQIFGGEPLLNIDTIGYICSYFELLKNNHVITYTPLYGIVSNGSKFSKKAVEIMKKYNFIITISVDGNQFIHDKQRVSKFGEGTFEIVRKNYNTLINNGINKKILVLNVHIQDIT